ncbi:hypothetical protein E2562_015126 [Oryza meyeriana var. granulata]|uniref:Wall-associated receptor kinase galacturonan-binding domain-containing protein n=1 Tax=Oryza meyeriana var. granulata TaxID=110450 RepID=A0A6G1DVT3_9ORYZ|nr:hypothetical protein E2562_015126 [Oryza meyeriana var. granulata]
MGLVLLCVAIAAGVTVVCISGASPPHAAASVGGCPTSCGRVSISYPFGVGDGCFRRGFQLTCNGATNPPKLFMSNTTTEILSVYPNGTAYSPIVFNIAGAASGPFATHERSWEAPGRVLAIDPDRSSMVIVGCGIEAYLLDLDVDTSQVIGYCASKCVVDVAAMKKEAEGERCNGMGCCAIGFRKMVRAMKIIITRKDDEAAAAAANQTVASFGNVSIKAFLASDQYHFSVADLMADEVNYASTITGATPPPLLSAVMTDEPDCPRAQSDQKKYACGSNVCGDVPNGGYFCSCSDTSDGSNPYVPDGCEGTPTKPRQELIQKQQQQHLEEGIEPFVGHNVNDGGGVLVPAWNLDDLLP